MNPDAAPESSPAEFLAQVCAAQQVNERRAAVTAMKVINERLCCDDFAFVDEVFQELSKDTRGLPVDTLLSFLAITHPAPRDLLPARARFCIIFGELAAQRYDPKTAARLVESFR